MNEEFKDQVEVDPYNLDKNAAEHSKIFAEWSIKYAQAVRDRDIIKEEISRIKAELDSQIRANPEEFGWLKGEKAPTETFIANKVLEHEDYQEVTNRFIEAQYNVNMLAGAKEAFEHRRKMIGVLTDLYTSNYFSDRPLTDKQEKAVDHKNETERLKNNARLMKRS